MDVRQRGAKANPRGSNEYFLDKKQKKTVRKYILNNIFGSYQI